MTLIITEISQYGIAMVADSAVTVQETLPSGRTELRVLNGARKLQAIPYLKAGLSAWGMGTLKGSTWEASTDLWLADFIAQNRAIATLDDFANTLADQLQGIVGSTETEMGIHLAGYVEVNGHSMPSFYHVRNNDGDYKQGYTLHEFVPGRQYGPKDPGDEVATLRNGFYGPYAILDHHLRLALNAVRQDPALKLTIPHPSLEGRIAYHAACVKFVSDLFGSAHLQRVIGGTIDALGITPDQRPTYYRVT